MHERIELFIRNAARSKVGLDVALFYQANPNTFDTASGIALRTHRGVEEVRPALEHLAEHGVLEVHVRQDGKYTCYALSRDADVWNTLCRVSEAYHDMPDTRKDIIRVLVELQKDQRSKQSAATDADGGERPQ